MNIKDGLFMMTVKVSGDNRNKILKILGGVI